MLITPVIPEHVEVTLNIGLSDSIALGKYKHINHHDGKVLTLVDILNTPYRVADVLARIKHLSDVPLNYKVVQSNTEATLVVKYVGKARNVISDAFKLSDDLQQDCIAVWIHNPVNGGVGQLIGRYNYVWGAFNPAYFVHI